MQEDLIRFKVSNEKMEASLNQDWEELKGAINWLAQRAQSGDLNALRAIRCVKKLAVNLAITAMFTARTIAS